MDLGIGLGLTTQRRYGSGVVSPPPGDYLLGADGNYLTDADGDYLIPTPLPAPPEPPDQSSGSTSFSAATGAFPAGWTARWVTSGVTTREAVGGYLRMVVGTAGRHGVSMDATDAASGRVQVRAKVRSNVASGVNGYVGPVLCGSGAAGAESGYAARLFYSTSAAFISVLKLVNGTATTLQLVSFPWVTNTWYWIVGEYDPATDALRFKWWADGGTEPGTWNYEVTDPDLTSGWLGLWSFSPSTGDVDFFSYGTNGAAAPTP